MSVRVRYFAALRERIGREVDEVELVPGETLAALYARLCPTTLFDGQRLPVAYARNHAYASGDDQPADGDEIGFLPPIGGG
ncbi:MAG: MoaD/ThiS family protein [Myxococcota bacterium]